MSTMRCLVITPIIVTIVVIVQPIAEMNVVDFTGIDGVRGGRGPTYVVSKGLGHDVVLIPAGVESQLALVGVGLTVAATDRYLTRLRAVVGTRAVGAVRALDAVAARVALEIHATQGIRNACVY